MSDAPLVIAVPSKGRLQENAAAFFGRAGLSFTQARGAREYRAAFAGVPDVEILFLSASEIVAQLASGAAHLGVTGEDLVREALPDAATRVEMLTPLGFGHANVVVAAPQAWIDVRTMSDLDEVAADMRTRHGRRLRVATKYVNLTRAFFGEKGVSDYRIVESLGATEGAPAAGTAEIIVDITTTGATLAANALKILDDGVILRSEANLVASLGADWGARARSAARAILGRIAAEEAARATREIRAALRADAVIDLDDLSQRFEARAPYGRNGVELVLRCPAPHAHDLVATLLAAGAEEISMRGFEALFRPTNPLIERLEARLGELPLS
jgi:ATP phosphoribosyltransferase